MALGENLIPSAFPSNLAGVSETRQLTSNHHLLPPLLSFTVSLSFLLFLSSSSFVPPRLGQLGLTKQAPDVRGKDLRAVWVRGSKVGANEACPVSLLFCFAFRCSLVLLTLSLTAKHVGRTCYGSDLTLVRRGGQV